ncbi:perforin-like protein 1 isoform X1 [Oculina patagonica]
MEEQDTMSIPNRGNQREVRHYKSSVSVAVAVAVVAGLLITLYPYFTRSTLSAFPKMLALEEKDPTNYDFGVRMDVQVQDCSSDTHWKKTFPDLDYSLLGYDILYGYPLANGRDPGFRHPIFSANYSKPKQTSDCRYVVPQGFTVIPSESCVVSFESKLVRNKQEMSQHLGVQAKVEGGGWGFEFSASTSYNKDTSEMSTGEYMYIMSHAQCQNYYSMVDFKNPPPFDPGFLAAANKLADPNASDEDVIEFIEYYGTHFFTDVTFGAKFVQKHKVSQTAYQSLSKSKISVEVQASYSGLFSIGGGFSLDKEQSEAASNFSKAVETNTFTVGSTPPANGDAMTWASSVQQNPVPMLYSLSQIDNLFTGQFSQHLTPGVKYDVVREKLSNVSQQYCQALKNKGTVHSCESKFHLEAEGIDIAGPGYRHLREVDKPLCISSCLEEPNCTAVTYSIHKPPHASSLCKFYSSAIDDNLYLKKQDGSNVILSNLILFISKRQDVSLYHAKLNGTKYLESKKDELSCFMSCTEDLFCDAVSYSAGGCSMYSTKDITNIVIENGSNVTFVGFHITPPGP